MGNMRKIGDELVAMLRDESGDSSPEGMKRIRRMLADKVVGMYDEGKLPVDARCGCCDVVSYEIMMIGDARCTIRPVLRSKGVPCH